MFPETLFSDDEENKCPILILLTYLVVDLDGAPREELRSGLNVRGKFDRLNIMAEDKLLDDFRVDRLYCDRLRSWWGKVKGGGDNTKQELTEWGGERVTVKKKSVKRDTRLTLSVPSAPTKVGSRHDWINLNQATFCFFIPEPRAEQI